MPNLRRLWEQYVATCSERDDAQRVLTAAEEAAFGESGPAWTLHSVEYCPSRAVFVSGRDATTKVVRLKSKTATKCQAEAREIQKRLSAERAQAVKAANRKHRVNALDTKLRRVDNQLSDIIDAIAETPAEGMIGLAIKLAACRQERDFIQETALSLVDSAYASASRLTGIGLCCPGQSLDIRQHAGSYGTKFACVRWQQTGRGLE